MSSVRLEIVTESTADVFSTFDVEGRVPARLRKRGRIAVFVT